MFCHSSNIQGSPPIPVLDPPNNASESLRTLYNQLKAYFLMGQRGGVNNTNIKIDGQAKQRPSMELPLVGQAIPVTRKRDRRELQMSGGDQQGVKPKRERLEGPPASAGSDFEPSFFARPDLPQQTLQQPQQHQPQGRPDNRRRTSGEGSGSVNSLASHSAIRSGAPQLSNDGVSQQILAPTNAGSSSSANMEMQAFNGGLPQTPMQQQQLQYDGNPNMLPPAAPGSAGQFFPSQNAQASEMSPYTQLQSDGMPQTVQPPPRVSSAASMHSPASTSGPGGGHFRQPSAPLSATQPPGSAQQAQLQAFLHMPQAQPQSVNTQPSQQQQQNQQQQQQLGHRLAVNFETLAQDIMRLQSQLSSARAVQENREIYEKLPLEAKKGLKQRIQDQEGQLDQLRRIYDQAVRAGQLQQQQQLYPQQQQEVDGGVMMSQQTKRRVASGGSPLVQQPPQPLQPIPYQRAPSAAPHVSAQRTRETEQQHQLQHGEDANAVSSPAASHVPSPATTMHNMNQSPQISNRQRPPTRQAMMPPPQQQLALSQSGTIQQAPLGMEHQQAPPGELMMRSLFYLKFSDLCVF